MSSELKKGKAGSGDLLLGDSTTTQNQNRRNTSGGITSHPVQPIDTAVIPASTAAVASSGVAPGSDLDDIIADIYAGGSIPDASIAVKGVSKLSVAPASPTNPIAVGTNDPRMLTQDESDGIGAAQTAITASNPAWSFADDRDTRWLVLGSGRDGHGRLGSIADPASAPLITDAATAGNLTGTFTYKKAAANLSGSTAASSMSASTGALVGKRVTLDLGALPAGASHWEVYRSTDGANWYFVGKSLTSTYVDNSPAKNTSSSAPGSNTTGNTASLTGEYHFTDFTMVSGQSITVPASGDDPAALIIRCAGAASIPSGVTISANAVNLTNAPTIVSSPHNGANGSGGTGGSGGIGRAAKFDVVRTRGTAGNGAAGVTSGAGNPGTPGAGGAGATASGGLVAILAASWTDTGGTITTNGGNGSNGSTPTSGPDGSPGAGGGGAGTPGGVVILGSLVPQQLTGTVQSNGGNGGNGGNANPGGFSGINGAFNGGGGGGGGGSGSGGAVILLGPLWEVTGTVQANAGTPGTGGTNGSGSYTAAGGGGGGGGASCGNGGSGGATGATATSGSAGSAGQIINGGIFSGKLPYARAAAL